MRATLLASLLALLILAFFFVPWTQDGRFQSAYQLARHGRPILFLIPAAAALVFAWSLRRLGHRRRLSGNAPPLFDSPEVAPATAAPPDANPDPFTPWDTPAATASLVGEPATESVILPPTDTLPLAEPLEPGLLAWLVIGDGPRRGERFRLRPVTTIGRIPGNTICLDDPTLSHFHAEAKLTDGRFSLYDKGSTNGVCVYNAPQSAWQRVDCCELRDGMRVKLGRLVLCFMAVEPLATEPLTPEP